MLSGRELALEQEPDAARLGQPADHRTPTASASRWCPVNEVDRRGPAAALVRDLPPVSNSGAPPISQPRIYFGERPSDYVIVGARQDEFDYPRGTTPRRLEADQTTRWTGNTGIPLDSTLRGSCSRSASATSTC